MYTLFVKFYDLKQYTTNKSIDTNLILTKLTHQMGRLSTGKLWKTYVVLELSKYKYAYEASDKLNNPDDKSIWAIISNVARAQEHLPDVPEALLPVKDHTLWTLFWVTRFIIKNLEKITNIGNQLMLTILEGGDPVCYHKYIYIIYV